MANSVVGSTVGGSPVRLSGMQTVGDVRRALNLPVGYTVMANGEPASDSDLLQEEAYVSFAPAVKGGLIS